MVNCLIAPSKGGSSHRQNCNLTAFFLSKNKFRLGLGCREDGFAVFMIYTQAEGTRTHGAWPVFRVQKCAGPNTEGKHQLLQWRKATSLLCLLWRHKPQTESSEVTFRTYFLPCLSISICIILLKNKSSSVHVDLDSLKLVDRTPNSLMWTVGNASEPVRVSASTTFWNRQSQKEKWNI